MRSRRSGRYADSPPAKPTPAAVLESGKGYLALRAGLFDPALFACSSPTNRALLIR